MRLNSDPSSAPTPNDDRILDSWKEIASYLGRAVRTVQTWERKEGLPVHRHQHSKSGTVYAYPAEIDAWWRGRAELTNGGKKAGGLLSRRAWPVTVAVAALALGAGAWLLNRVEVPEPDHNASPAQTEMMRDWLVITGFENTTGEAVLDGTLEAGLRRELANSGFVKVAPKERIDDVLLLMGRLPGAGIDAATAREVAVRDGGVRAILTGSVDKLGSSYLLNVDIVNAADGVQLAGLSEQANSLEDILPTMRSLSRQVRKTLGESLPALDSAESLSRVSTPSFRSLELYSRADRLLLEENRGGPGRNEAAEGLLREAIVEDPAFASSYTLLAWTIWRQRRPDTEYLPHAKRATELMDKATAVERYFIRGSYYDMRALSSGKRPDLEEAVAQYHALLQLDSTHYWASNNAIVGAQKLGQGSEGLALLLGLVEARPNDVWTLSRAAQNLLRTTGDLSGARVYVERIRQLQIQQSGAATFHIPFVDFFSAHESWVRGDIEGALQEVDRLAERLDDLPAEDRGGRVSRALQHYLSLGMLEKAVALRRRYSSHQARWKRDLALWRDDRESIKEAILRSSKTGGSVQMNRTAFLLANFGYVTEAEGFLERLPPGFELEMGRLLATRGIGALAAGRYREAASLLQQALPHLRDEDHLGGYFIAAQSLSRAWEARGQPEQGLTVLDEASRKKPSAYFFLTRLRWMKLQLRRAELYRAAGHEARARAIEDELRLHCAYADPDFPILLELRRREGSQEPPSVVIRG